MIFSIDTWLDEFAIKIKNEFVDQVIFIGLQGSYQRNEATASSDIDVVVILMTLTIEDLKKYKNIIAQMPYKEKVCGFISGKREIMGWEKADLFQFYYDTKPIYGNIDYLLPLIGEQDIKCAIKIGACNLYHAGCHNFIYEDSREILAALYKSAFFVLQAKYFYEKKQYVSSKSELVSKLKGIDKEILEICIERERIRKIDDEALSLYSDKIITWSSGLIKDY
jgi:Nucleotidyltransferase domain.